jgi:hypothetical protein
MQAGQCGSQMGTRFWDMVFDEHGIGGDREYYKNDAKLDIINVFYHKAWGGKFKNYSATTSVHTQRALHGAYSSSGWGGKTTSLSRSGYTRARHRRVLFPVPNYHTEFLTFLRSPPPFFFRVLPASRMLLRAMLCTCRRASAVARWAPGFGI